MLPPFSLPSKPETKIFLREATVAEAIDFAGVNVGQEEEVTTLFLNKVQDKASFSDCRGWTAEDRRFALYWYFVNTPGDKDVPLYYDCQHCGETHHFLQDYHKMIDTYKSIQGLPEREFDWECGKVIVKPVDGHGMEELEEMRLVLDSIGDENSGDYQRQLARMRFTRFELAITFSEPDSWGGRILDKIKGQDKRLLEAEAKEKAAKDRAAKRKKIISMPIGKFEEFAACVVEKLAEMEHGLESAYEEGKGYMFTPPHQCPVKKDDKEATTRLRVTFRNSDYIPRLH